MLAEIIALPLHPEASAFSFAPKSSHWWSLEHAVNILSRLIEPLLLPSIASAHLLSSDTNRLESTVRGVHISALCSHLTALEEQFISRADEPAVFPPIYLALVRSCASEIHRSMFPFQCSGVSGIEDLGKDASSFLSIADGASHNACQLALELAAIDMNAIGMIIASEVFNPIPYLIPLIHLAETRKVYVVIRSGKRAVSPSLEVLDSFFSRISQLLESFAKDILSEQISLQLGLALSNSGSSWALLQR